MSTVSRSLLAIAGAGLLLATSSCRATQSLLQNRDAEPFSNISWVATAEIEPRNPATTKIYVRFRNIAGTPAFDFIGKEIKNAATEAGYTLTTNPDEAGLFYQVNLRHFGEDPYRDGGRTLLGAAGAIGVGVAAGAGVASATGNNTVGALAGFGAGAIADSYITNATQVTEWALLVDVTITERLGAGAVTTNLSSDKNANSNVNTNQGTGLQTIQGDDRGNTTNKQEATRTGDTFNHRARLYGMARQIKMTEDEAVAEISKKLPSMLKGMIP